MKQLKYLINIEGFKRISYEPKMFHIIRFAGSGSVAKMITEHHIPDKMFFDRSGLIICIYNHVFTI